MCRLAFYPEGVERIMDRGCLVYILDKLELSSGGDGNGFYFWADDMIRKSVVMSINRLIKKGRWKKGFIFHTRKATHGDIVRRNTHPFRLPGGDVVAHNGVWYEKDWKKFNLRTECDSEVLGLTLQKMGWVINPIGHNVVLAKVGDKLSVCVQSLGDLVVCSFNGYHWLQSEVPPLDVEGISSYDVKPGSYMIDPTSDAISALPEAVKWDYKDIWCDYKKIWDD